jgi:purine-binding chemotaxis protein CheW
VTISAVSFPIGHDRYAVAANTVREVVCQPHAIRLPTAPAVLLGVFNLRGHVVPMFDVAALLGVGSSTTASFAVVVSTPAGPAGLAVSGLPKVVELEDPIGPSELRGSLGIYRVEGGLAVLVDVEALLVPHSNLDDSSITEGLVAR